jgi:uncharacterized membrane protein
MRTAPARDLAAAAPSNVAVSAPPSACGPGEVAVVALALAALFAITIYAAAADNLFTRHFWLDEYLTSLIVRDPSVTHSISAVRGGVDTNPPVYHLLLRGFYAIVGGRAEVTFRASALLCTCIALVVTYAVLRRSFAVAPAALATLSLVAHPLVLTEAFEARFYAPLLAATACFAFCLCRGGTRGPNGLWCDVSIALAAALTCTLHYFGVFALAAVVVGECFVRDSNRSFLRRLIPVAAGPAALLAMIPFFLGQRAGLSVATWMPPVSLNQIGALFTSVFYAMPLAVVLVAWCVTRIITRQRQPLMAARVAPVAGLTALAAVPFIVLAFSLVVQPSLAPKYAIVAALALTPIVAALAAPLRPVVTCVAAVLIVVLAFFNIRKLSEIAYQRSEVARARAERVSHFPDMRPIVTTSRDGAYMLQYVAPSLAGRVALVDVRPLANPQQDRLYCYEMDMANKVRRFYPTPRVIDVPALRALGPFHFEGSIDELAWLRERVPLRDVETTLWEVE